MLNEKLMLPFKVYKYIYDVAFGDAGDLDDNPFLVEVLENLSVAYPLSAQQETVIKAGAPQYGHELDKIKEERLKIFLEIINKGIYEDKVLEKELGKEFIYVNKNVLLSDDSRSQLLGYTYSLMDIDKTPFELPEDVAKYLNTKLNLQLANPDQLKFKNLTNEQKEIIKRFSKSLNEKLKRRTWKLNETEEQFIRGLHPSFAYDLDTASSVALYNYQPWQKVFTENQMKLLTSTAYNLERLVTSNSLNREQNEALAQALSNTLINPEHLKDKTLLDNDDLYYIREFAQDLAYNAALYLDFTPEQELFINSLGGGLTTAIERYKQEKEKWQDSIYNKANPGNQVISQPNQNNNIPINITPSPVQPALVEPAKNLNKIKRTSSFSGADAVISLLFPDSPAIVVGTASTVTYSVYRQLAQVRTVGRQSSKGYARGGITYAGTMIFTVINQSFIYDLKANLSYLGDLNYLRPDQLPPFDINVSYANEYGQTASMTIYGATFVDETMTISVEDMFTENVLTFMARDIRHLKENEDVNTVSSVKFRGKDEILTKFIEVPKKTVDKPAVNNQSTKTSQPAKNATSSNTSGQSNNNTNPGSKPSSTTGSKPSSSSKPKTSNQSTNDSNQNKGTSTVNKPKTNSGNITPPSTSTKKLVVIKLTVQDNAGTKIKGAKVELKLNGAVIKNGSKISDKNGVVQFSNVDIGTNKIFQVVISATTFETLNQSLDIRSKENNKVIEETFKLSKENQLKVKIEKDNYITTTNKILTGKGIEKYDDMPRVKISGLPLDSIFEIKWRMTVVFKADKKETLIKDVIITQDYLSKASNMYSTNIITSSFKDCYISKSKANSNLMSQYVDFNLSKKFPHPIINEQVDLSQYYKPDAAKDISKTMKQLEEFSRIREVNFNFYPTIEITLMAYIEESTFTIPASTPWLNKSNLPKNIVTFKFTVNK